MNMGSRWTVEVVVLHSQRVRGAAHDQVGSTRCAEQLLRWQGAHQQRPTAHRAQ